MEPGVIIAGGGQGGYQAAASLRTEGYTGPITLVSEEPHLPYQRPPLSKAFVLGKQDADRIILRPEAYYSDHRICLLKGERVVSIDREAASVLLGSGARLNYQWLILATGATNRRLSVSGSDLEGVHYLRTLDEARAVKAALEAVGNVVVIGGGFIGLEIAATARTLGKEVTVVELMPTLMSRAIAPVLSDYFCRCHSQNGVNVLLRRSVAAIHDEKGRVSGVILEDGTKIAAELVVVGIGVIPNTALAREAGLTISNGISTDELLRTSDSNIFAIGDCSEHPNAFTGGPVRLESVQNAVDQAVSVARTITGKPVPYRAVPWFWTDQFDIRMQMVGISSGFDQTVTRGMMDSHKFSLFYFRAGQLIAIDSVNRPSDHMVGRKLIAAHKSLTPQQAADEQINLKDLV